MPIFLLTISNMGAVGFCDGVPLGVWLDSDDDEEDDDEK